MYAFLAPLLILLALAGCSKPVDQTDPVRPALVYTIVEHGSQQIAAYSGEIHARRETALGFRVGGKVAARMVEPGDSVKPGQVLGRLDPADAQLARNQAAAQLAGAESDALNAAAELARAQKLVEKKFLSQSVLEARMNASAAASARLHAARAQFELAGNQSNYTALTADAAGVVTTVRFEVGQVVGAGQEVARVAYSGEQEVHVRLGEAQAQGIKPGLGVQVRLWTAPQRPYAGTVREIAPAADENRTYLVKVTVNQADSAIKLGMTASVRMPGAVHADKATLGVSLPPGALFQQGKQAAVWVVNAQQEVEPVPVEIVQFGNDAVLVQGALPVGTRVIAAGAHKLHPRQKIQPQPFETFNKAGA